MRVWPFVALLAATAVLLGWWGWVLDGSQPVDVTVVVPLTVLGVLGVILRERNLGPHIGVSVATVVLATALPLAGSVGAVIVGFSSYACDVRQQRLRTRAFNAAMSAAVGAAGALAYLATGGVRIAHITPGPAELVLRVGLPLLVAYAVMTVVNAVAIAVMSALVRGTRVLELLDQVWRSVGWGYLSHVVIAFLFAVLWGPAGLGALSAVFVLVPLVVAHWSIGREALARREHQETVTTFVAALEQADPHSVGHSARVAALADQLAPALGIGGQDAEDLRYAALLHDIGLVAVRSELPADPAAQEIAYLSAISSHPEAGVAVLRDLDFLTGALPAIAHHHERYDGRGYPAGLSGEDIPLAARIIAVADAYDALMVRRGQGNRGRDRDEESVVAALRARVGTHLDPVVVEALAAALTRRPGGVLTEPTAAGAAAATGAHGPSPAVRDHDHPSVSDAFADWQPEVVGRP
ncbi:MULTISPECIES: HD-GYP domain-containing protein [unclassified Ornithinimicrobium]|uniref:HD-GYP domain-containing protein n=1 Tax=unclassified Ornithinimicrobium TaxID=2615080 RepID=UPI003851C631